MSWKIQNLYLTFKDQLENVSILYSSVLCHLLRFTFCLFTKEDYLLFIHFVNGLTATDRQIKIVEEPDLDSKKLQDLSLQNSGSNVSLSNSKKLEERPNDNGSSCEDSRNNMNFSSSIASKKRNQEVSRKGNGMGVSGWKSQFCMNGITFCFKVGTLLRATGMFSHIKRLYC